ncbi:MAG: hypothetical protein AAFY56_15330 [Pseudomonadota bacterium]
MGLSTIIFRVVNNLISVQISKNLGRRRVTRVGINCQCQLFGNEFPKIEFVVGKRLWLFIQRVELDLNRLRLRRTKDAEDSLIDPCSHRLERHNAFLDYFRLKRPSHNILTIIVAS